MPIVPHDDCLAYGVCGNKNLGVATPRLGAREIEAWYNVMRPAHETPVHRHESEEIVVVISGSGELLSFRHDNESLHPAQAHIDPFEGPCTLILHAGRFHQLRNTGSCDLVTVAAMRIATRIEDSNGLELQLPWRC